MNSSAKLVTRNARPFRLIDDSGFRKIIDPVLKPLIAKRAITAETVKDRARKKQKASQKKFRTR
ncbi:hypothetical protein HPB48_012594 [Haemaphysalis longicornis]|uniref:Uncharacterized protein n=1 Tax=Haemaphysalis longicornis TaxID=44386 RepID=A0A9J6GAI7_HAELO|nr:hypothetical protein HPB48_012594 [Haemaphysalis longicornis]